MAGLFSMYLADAAAARRLRATSAFTEELRLEVNIDCIPSTASAASDLPIRLAPLRESPLTGV
jgi:hypothetical protein